VNQISKILSGEETSIARIPKILSLGNLAYFKYAPINSVDVQRSFSMFKVLLTDNNTSFQFEKTSYCPMKRCVLILNILNIFETKIFCQLFFSS